MRRVPIPIFLRLTHPESALIWARLAKKGKQEAIRRLERKQRCPAVGVRRRKSVFTRGGGGGSQAGGCPQLRLGFWIQIRRGKDRWVLGKCTEYWVIVKCEKAFISESLGGGW